MQTEIWDHSLAHRLGVSDAAIKSWCRDGRFLGAHYVAWAGRWSIPLPIRLHPRVGKAMAVFVCRSVSERR